MTGAQALLRTLVDAGVTRCFTNPGTSEMHFVAELDTVTEMHAILALFEGVATGAADGYARMADRPAATLLHLGPGLGNGLANLHNARRAKVPVVNVVGDHATYHARFDAQLQSDIETVARNVSGWVRTSQSTESLPTDAAEAIAAAVGPPGQVATLVLPADVSWSEGATPAAAPVPRPARAPEPEVVEEVAGALRGRGASALLLGGRALREPALVAAGRIAAATGTKVFVEPFPTRLQRGAGLPAAERIAYLAELATVQLAGLRHLVLVDARAPVSFFAYPGRESDLVPAGCEVHELAAPDQDALAALEALADAAGAAGAQAALQAPSRPPRPTGALTADSACQAIAAVLPEGAIVSDEALTSGVTFAAHTAGGPRHDVLTLTGGAIGQGLPVAIGAAVACPDRPVLALEGEGSAMYTIQSLWTMAREQLDVTVVIFNNRSYAILNIELERVGAKEGGPRAKSQLNLAGPDLDFLELARGQGVPAVRAQTAEELTGALESALSEPGPHLIEALVPSAYSGLRLRAMPHALRALTKLPAPLGRAAKRRFYP
ncbi:MAG TPA: acetolactate synthase large subunit [Solirubrobacteraceae bacterium]|nr:acetolactate synthase large subunit [Solirubrobacteraceae bacterium]